MVHMIKEDGAVGERIEGWQVIQDRFEMLLRTNGLWLDHMWRYTGFSESGGTTCL